MIRVLVATFLISVAQGFVQDYFKSVVMGALAAAAVAVLCSIIPLVRRPTKDEVTFTLCCASFLATFLYVVTYYQRDFHFGLWDLMLSRPFTPVDVVLPWYDKLLGLILAVVGSAVAIVVALILSVFGVMLAMVLFVLCESFLSLFERPGILVKEEEYEEKTSPPE